MDSLGYQTRLRGVVLDSEPAEGDLVALGAEAWRWVTYRRLVRNRLYETIDHCFARLSAHVGRERFRQLVDAFLVAQGSRSPYLRDLPGELLAWLEHQAAGALPPYALDLARLEWAELETAYTEDDLHRDSLTDFTMELPAALSPAHRLLWLGYPVHLLATDAPGAPEVEALPVVLCLYRDPRTYEVHILELSPITGALLREIARSRRPLLDVVRSVAGEHGAVVDGSFVEALSAVLADLMERGLILGSLSGGR